MNRRSAQKFILEFGTAYLWFYSLCRNLASGEQVQRALKAELADFNGQEGIFVDLSQDVATFKKPTEPFIPRKVWLLYTDTLLSSVALALLSCSASEAAVERTFSAQGLIHSKRRNALLNDAVESEMMLRFNRAALSIASTADFGCIEMTDDASEVDSLAPTVIPEKPEAEELAALQLDESADIEADDDVKESEVVASSAAAAASVAPPSSAQQRALRRAKSITFATMDEFLDWFIAELKLTANSKLNSDVKNALERHSSKLINPPGSASLILFLRSRLASA